MLIFPLLVLDQNDLKPFVDAYKKQLKAPDSQEFVITSIVPVALGNGQWSVELKAEPVKQAE